jgi:hypothetical protein
MMGGKNLIKQALPNATDPNSSVYLQVILQPPKHGHQRLRHCEQRLGHAQPLAELRRHESLPWGRAGLDVVVPFPRKQLPRLGEVVGQQQRLLLVAAVPYLVVVSCIN